MSEDKDGKGSTFDINNQKHEVMLSVNEMRAIRHALRHQIESYLGSAAPIDTEYQIECFERAKDVLARVETWLGVPKTRWSQADEIIA